MTDPLALIQLRHMANLGLFLHELLEFLHHAGPASGVVFAANCFLGQTAMDYLYVGPALARRQRTMVLRFGSECQLAIQV